MNLPRYVEAYLIIAPLYLIKVLPAHQPNVFRKIIRGHIGILQHLFNPLPIIIILFCHLWKMYIVFRIAAVGVLVAVLNQVLLRAGREEQAMLTTLAGLVVVLFWVIQYVSTLFETMETMFRF